MFGLKLSTWAALAGALAVVAAISAGAAKVASWAAQAGRAAEYKAQRDEAKAAMVDLSEQLQAKAAELATEKETTRRQREAIAASNAANAELERRNREREAAVKAAAQTTAEREKAWAVREAELLARPWPADCPDAEREAARRDLAGSFP